MISLYDLQEEALRALFLCRLLLNLTLEAFRSLDKISQQLLENVFKCSASLELYGGKGAF